MTTTYEQQMLAVKCAREIYETLKMHGYTTPDIGQSLSDAYDTIAAVKAVESLEPKEGVWSDDFKDYHKQNT